MASIRMLLLELLLLSITGCYTTITFFNESSTRGDIIKAILRDYDPSVPPDYERNIATRVYVQIYIHSVDSFSETSMDYSLTIFLRQKWVDQRLRINTTANLPEPLELDSRTMSNVWVPDLYFTNEKKGDFHHVTVPNKLMHLYRNGTVFYSVRLTLVLTCQMNLATYPLDDQQCPIIVESYSYSMDNMEFKWHPDVPVKKDHNLNLPHFALTGINHFECTRSYGEVCRPFVRGCDAGNFTCLRADLNLKRDFGYYAIQIYIPYLLIVVLSWVSFWLDIDAIPARISLGVLTVLTLTTQTSGLRNSLPKVSYIKALDIWMAMCLMFVFGALVEFALVNLLTRTGQIGLAHSIRSLRYTHRSKRERESKATDSEDTGGRQNCKSNGESDQKVKRKLQSRALLRIPEATRQKRAEQFDKLSRIGFPVVFLILNIIYWVFYTTWKPQ